MKLIDDRFDGHITRAAAHVSHQGLHRMCSYTVLCAGHLHSARAQSPLHSHCINGHEMEE